MNNCHHENFEAKCNVGRLTDGEDGPVTSWVIEVRVRCADCQLDFGFIGPPAGIRNSDATCSPDGLELRCPIAPGSLPRIGPYFIEFPESVIGKVRQA